jgi:hypothetical protein
MEDFSAAMFMSMTGISRRPFAACTAGKKYDGLKDLDIGFGEAAADAKSSITSICSGLDALEVLAVAAECVEVLGPAE